MPARRRVGTLRQIACPQVRLGRGRGNREGCGGQAVGLLASQELLRSHRPSSGHVGTLTLVTVSATFGSVTETGEGGGWALL